MKDILLIDADQLIYRAAFSACSTEKYLVNPSTGEELHFDDWRERVAMKKETGWAEHEKISVNEKFNYNFNYHRYFYLNFARFGSAKFDHEMYIQGDGNYRKQVAVTKEYKANRKRPPTYARAKEEFLKCDFNILAADGCEAEDLVGIRHYGLKGRGIVCHVDKDLMMLEGRHYNFGKAKLFQTSPRAAFTHFLKQMVTGDATDNIGGIPKAGPAAALKLQKEVQGKTALAALRHLQEVYTKAGLSEDYFNEQARLLWIQRDAELPLVDFEDLCQIAQGIDRGETYTRIYP